MAIPHVESTERQPSAPYWTIHRHSRSFGWLGSLINELGRWRTVCAIDVPLDEMSEGQLEEIGMRRFARRAMWLDCRESALGMELHYRSVPGERDLDV